MKIENRILAVLSTRERDPRGEPMTSSIALDAEPLRPCVYPCQRVRGSERRIFLFRHMRVLNAASDVGTEIPNSGKSGAPVPRVAQYAYTHWDKYLFPSFFLPPPFWSPLGCSYMTFGVTVVHVGRINTRRNTCTSLRVYAHARRPYVRA